MSNEIQSKDSMASINSKVFLTNSMDFRDFVTEYFNTNDYKKEKSGCGWRQIQRPRL